MEVFSLKIFYLLLMLTMAVDSAEPFDPKDYEKKNIDHYVPEDFQFMAEQTERNRQLKMMEETEKETKWDFVKIMRDPEIQIAVLVVFVILTVVAVIVVCYCIRLRKELRLLKDRRSPPARNDTSGSSGVILTYIEQKFEDGNESSNETVNIEMDSLPFVTHL